jgi:CO/xanthine dehydrogenase FAD-binding subunit
MFLPKFDYHEPETLDGAVELMDEIGERASILAGGTDLLVNMKKRKVSPEHLISLSRVPEVNRVVEKDESLFLGAYTTVAEVTEQSEIHRGFHALSTAAGLLGSPLIRNLATVGGNLVTGRPAADLPPALISHGASVVLTKKDGERTVLLEDFIKGPGQTAIEPAEILTSVLLTEPPPFSGSGYVKLGVRKTLEISIVNAAAFLALDGPQGRIRESRIVLGSVAPKPIRAPAAEAVLIGGKGDEVLFHEAGKAAAADAEPIDDFRASAAYRVEMIRMLTQKALRLAYKNATS